MCLMLGNVIPGILYTSYVEVVLFMLQALFLFKFNKAYVCMLATCSVNRNHKRYFCNRLNIRCIHYVLYKERLQKKSP